LQNDHAVVAGKDRQHLDLERCARQLPDAPEELGRDLIEADVIACQTTACREMSGDIIGQAVAGCVVVVRLNAAYSRRTTALASSLMRVRYRKP